MRILGVSCDLHDAAAALVVDGQVVAAAEEERFTRRKHDAAVPARAIASCLAMAGMGAEDLDAVVVHEKPLMVMSRYLAARQRRGPAGLGSFARDMPQLIGRNAMVGYRIEKVLVSLGARRTPPITYSEHHLSHAAAAFFPSPFRSAAVLTVDGVGEWATATISRGVGHELDLVAEQRYPHSFGLLYSLVTAWCGFEPNDGEYKLMGLAPFGIPRYADALAELAQVHDDGSLRIDAKTVRWWSGDPRRLRRLEALFDGPARQPDAPITQRDADLARSAQELVERAMGAMVRHAREITGETQVCLGGGVALNCVANGSLLRSGAAPEVWVQPAPSDAGSALGAALWHWHQVCGNPRLVADDRDGAPADGMDAAALGPSFPADEVAAWLGAQGVEHRRLPDPDDLAAAVAARLADGDIVGWFEGRMEFGPRALGHRSILADPRSTTVHADLNLRVKGRESFRPFAPAVLWEEAGRWFSIDRPSPYMLFTFPVAPERLVPLPVEPTDLMERARAPRSEIPACTHIDGSARVQTVHADRSPAFHELLRAFQERTGCPVLLNTSFNVAGEPIVCTPDDALRTARRAGLDLLVIEDCLIALERPASPT